MGSLQTVANVLTVIKQGWAVILCMVLVVGTILNAMNRVNANEKAIADTDEKIAETDAKHAEWNEEQDKNLQTQLEILKELRNIHRTQEERADAERERDKTHCREGRIERDWCQRQGYVVPPRRD